MVFLTPRSKRNPKISLCLGFLLSLFLCGCSDPPLPPEAGEADKMAFALWKAEASHYAPEEYRSFETTLRTTREDLIRERSRFPWFQEYEPIAQRLRSLLKQGEEILKKVEERKEAKRVETASRLRELEDRIQGLERWSFHLNEGRLARRSLTKASLTLKEAGFALERGKFDEVASRLGAAQRHLASAEETLLPILNRFSDRRLLRRWKSWADAAVSESRDRGNVAIVVDKLARRLVLYREGRSYKSFSIGIGRNGLADKLRAGDGATPEGLYRVIKKLPTSRYHKALLLNYPNEEDRKEFQRLKKLGRLPKGVGIGGLIEIHGGGKDGMTYGCVSLEDRQMDELFHLIPVGTPVAIVGTVFSGAVIPLPGEKQSDD